MKKQRLEKERKTNRTEICVGELCFFSPYPVNHVTTPQIYLATWWRGPGTWVCVNRKKGKGRQGCECACRLW